MSGKKQVMYEECQHCGARAKIRVIGGIHHDMFREYHFINKECVQECAEEEE